MRIDLKNIFWIVLACSIFDNSARDQESVVGVATLRLRSVLDLYPKRNGPAIENGQPANSAEYPASFMSTNSHGIQCTWFLVNSKTLVTAAHCTETGEKLEILKPSPIGANDDVYSGRCERLDAFAIDKSKDWALCLLDKNYDLPTGDRIRISGYEILNVRENFIKKRLAIQITGFGCVGVKKLPDGIYRVGWARVTILPPKVRIADPDVLGSTPNWIKIENNPAVLCGGDSGGPAFAYLDANMYYRVVVGVNSRKLNSPGLSNLGLGVLSSTSTKSAVNFFEDWAGRNGQRLCGLHMDAKGCRPILNMGSQKK